MRFGTIPTWMSAAVIPARVLVTAPRDAPGDGIGTIIQNVGDGIGTIIYNYSLFSNRTEAVFELDGSIVTRTTHNRLGCCQS